MSRTVDTFRRGYVLWLALAMVACDGGERSRAASEPPFIAAAPARAPEPSETNETVPGAQMQPISTDGLAEHFGDRHTDEARALLRVATLQLSDGLALSGTPAERMAQLRDLACERGVERIADASAPLVVAVHIQRHPESLSAYDLSKATPDEQAALAMSASEQRRLIETLGGDWEVIRQACSKAGRNDFPARYHEAAAQLRYLLSDTAGLIVSGNEVAAARLAELAGGRIPHP